MKRTLSIAVAGILAAVLSACNSGGGSSNVNPPVNPPAPVNTSLSYYLPLAQGNTWTFNSGEQLVDVGSGTLNCAGCYTGPVEELDVHVASSGAYGGASFYFTKQPVTSPMTTLWSDLIGISDVAGTNVTVISDSQYPQGLPIMDDHPVANESWTMQSGAVSSTILSVEGTMMMTGNMQVQHIATDRLNDPSANEIVTWGFAKGVGMATLSQGQSTTKLTAFHIDETHSFSYQPQPPRTFSARVGKPDLASAFAALLR